ncbi:MAG: hypothetical protein LC808_03415 [Actinobacteria bacterium]|nr:hypothetical protein [Actinomycetota bacterium]
MLFLALLAAGESWWDRNAAEIGLAGLVLGVVTAIGSVVIFYLQRDKKTFDWQVLTDEPIVTETSVPAGERIKVVWNDIELNGPRLITLRLVNTGKREIRAEDFNGHVVITTSEDLLIRSAGTIRTRDGMRHGPACKWTESKCDVSPVLYNRGDWAAIQLLVDEVEFDLVVRYSGREDDEPTIIRHEDRVFPSMGSLVGYESSITVDAVVAGQTRCGKRLPLSAAPLPKRFYIVLTAAAFISAVVGVVAALLQ